MTPFYSITEGTIKVPLLKVEEFLKDSGFFKFMVSPELTIYVKVQENKVTEVSPNDIYTFIMSQAKNCTLDNESEREGLVEKISASKYKITSNLSTILQPLDLNYIKDTKDTAYFFYKNVAVVIKKDKVELTEYSNLTGYVWNSQIINREYKGDLPPENFNDLHSPNNPYMCFLFNVSPQATPDALMSTIGYLLHTYKRSDFAKAVVIYDANIDLPDPCGGTGKTLLVRSLSFIRKLVQEDGKNNNLSSRFAFSRVTIDSDLFLMDDVPSSYPFDKLFALITGDFIVEKKNQDRFSIPFEQSPKVAITSNYGIIKPGESYTRRVIEFVIDNNFNPEYSPSKAFGHEFFKDWNEEQWHGFDNAMILAVQFYLKNGVVEQINGRKYYQLQNQTTKEFMTFACSLELKKRYDKKELLEDFMKQNPFQSEIESNTFTRWLKLYTQHKDWKTSETHSGNVNYIQFYVKKDEVEGTTGEATVEAAITADAE